LSADCNAHASPLSDCEQHQRKSLQSYGVLNHTKRVDAQLAGEPLMDRRRFLKAASGLFVPALPALILPGRTLAQSPVLPGPGLPVASGGALGLQTNLGAFFSLDNTLNDD